MQYVVESKGRNAAYQPSLPDSIALSHRSDVLYQLERCRETVRVSGSGILLHKRLQRSILEDEYLEDKHVLDKKII